MADQDDEDDNIPLLEDVLRPGDPSRSANRHGSGSANPGDGSLSEAEIEAIAARVVERHTQRIEAAVARAIHQAIEMKARMANKADGGGD